MGIGSTTPLHLVQRLRLDFPENIRFCSTELLTTMAPKELALTAASALAGNAGSALLLQMRWNCEICRRVML